MNGQSWNAFSQGVNSGLQTGMQIQQFKTNQEIAQEQLKKARTKNDLLSMKKEQQQGINQALNSEVNLREYARGVGFQGDVSALPDQNIPLSAAGSEKFSNVMNMPSNINKTSQEAYASQQLGNKRQAATRLNRAKLETEQQLRPHQVNVAEERVNTQNAKTMAQRALANKKQAATRLNRAKLETEQQLRPHQVNVAEERVNTQNAKTMAQRALANKRGGGSNQLANNQDDPQMPLRKQYSDYNRRVMEWKYGPQKDGKPAAKPPMVNNQGQVVWPNGQPYVDPVSGNPMTVGGKGEESGNWFSNAWAGTKNLIGGIVQSATEPKPTEAKQTNSQPARQQLKQPNRQPNQGSSETDPAEALYNRVRKINPDIETKKDLFKYISQLDKDKKAELENMVGVSLSEILKNLRNSGVSNNSPRATMTGGR